MSTNPSTPGPYRPPPDPPPRARLSGPLGLPSQPSRAPTPPPPPIPVELVPPAPKPTAAAQAAAEVVGFELPSVDRLVGSLQDANDVANRLSSAVMAVLSTNVASADAIQGKLTSQALDQIRSALQVATDACAGVHSCVVAQSLAAIGTVDQWLMTLPLPEEAQQAILAELGAIFGTTPPPTPQSVSTGDAYQAMVPGIGGLCQPGYRPNPADPSQCIPAAGPPAPGNPPLPLPPAPPGGGGGGVGGGHGTGPTCAQIAVQAAGIVAGAASLGGDVIQGQNAGCVCATGSDAPGYCTMPAAPAGWEWIFSGYSGSASLPCNTVYCLIATGAGQPSPPGPPAPPPPGPPAPPPPPPPPAPCPCVTCHCDPCECPECPDLSKACGPGTYWDPDSQQCLPRKPTPQTCPDGQHWSTSAGACVPDQTGQYCVYCRAADQTTYLVSPDEGPEEADDYILECYPSLEEVPPAADWPSCPTPPEPPEATTPGVFPAGGVWCSLNICDAIAGYTASLPTSTGVFQSLVNAVFAPESPFFSGEQFNDLPLIVKPLVQWLFSGLVSFFQFGGGLLQGFIANAGCLSPQYVASQLLSTFVGIFDRWLSSNFSELDISNSYYRHLMCPQLTLDAPQATAAYLAGAIDLPTLQCLVGANNQCWQPWQAYLESQRSKLNPDQLAALTRRGILSPDDYAAGMRKLGYTNPADPTNIYALTTQIPFVSDILRMMVRDAADENAVALFGMDAQFGQKWSGQLKQWGNQQGVEDLYAQYVWRSHWSIPSPTQLYEMFRRLRNTPPPAGFADWETVIQTALIQQDLLPFWIEPLTKIAFHPLTATDLVRAYSVGAIQEADVAAGYTQLGYSDNDAAALTAFRRRERIEQARTLPQSRLYLDDAISRTAYTDYLTSRNYPADDQEEILDLLDQRKSAKVVSVCSNNLKKRFMKGELSANDLTVGLTGLGIEPVQVAQLVARAQCEFSSRDPHLGIRLLIPLYKKSIIDVGEFLRRAGNLGILPDLAGKIVQQMDAELGDAAAAAQAKRLRQAQRAALQSAKAAARAAKQAAQAAARAQAAAAQQAKQAAALRKTIDSAVLKAIKAGAAEADATAAINDAIQSIETVYGASPAEAAAIATLAVETTPVWSDAAFAMAVSLAVQEHLTAVGGTG